MLCRFLDENIKPLAHEKKNKVKNLKMRDSVKTFDRKKSLWTEVTIGRQKAFNKSLFKCDVYLRSVTIANVKSARYV